MNYTFPPGPKGLPFFGKALDLHRDPLKFFTQIERKYGAIATVPIRNFRMVLATRASSIRYILIENAYNFTNREAYLGLVPLLGEGLLTIDGDFHKQQRRLVMPAFHRHRIESYEELMVDNTFQLATILQKFTPILAPGARIVPQPLITLRPRYGLPMILQETMKIAGSNHRHSEIVKMA